MALPRFFAPHADLESGPVELSGDEAHHLIHVLRLRVGARVGVFDGVGREWIGRVVATARGTASIELETESDPPAEPIVKITLGIGLLKGDQMDAVIRDATMLGVWSIVPLISERVSVPAQAWRSGRALDRWRRVAIASVKQCGRAVVPVIQPVTAFAEALTMEPSAIVIAVEPEHIGGEEIAGAIPPNTVLVLVGPEGGWAPAEVALALSRGARVIRLGPRILRAETVPTVLLSSLWTRWGW